MRQLGVDRIVDFTFGTGPATHHIILEMYSQVRCSGVEVVMTTQQLQQEHLQCSHVHGAELPQHSFLLFQGSIRQRVV